MSPSTSAARLSRLTCSLVVATLWGGCAEEDTSEVEDAFGSGATLEGWLQLAEGYELPRYKLQELSRPTLMPGEPAGEAECAQAGNVGGEGVGLSLGAKRGLEGAVVAAAEFVRHRRRKPRVHAVSIEHCRLTPTTVVAQRGDRLRIENHDEHPYRLTFGASIDPGNLLPGAKIVIDLHRVGVEPLLCPKPGSCGRTDVVVLYHPVATVTGKDGHFRIDDFPVGEGVVVGAWHPLLTETRTTLWLSPGEHTRTTLPIKPYDAPEEE